VETDDGWVLPLFRLDPAARDTAEPVLLVHSVAGSAHAFRYGGEALATALRDAGYRVFLATHRGDLDAVAPPGAGRVRLADLARRDLPAALQGVLAATGAQRVHVVGFGLGALLSLDLAATWRDEVASVTALAPPLRLPVARTHARALQLALGLLPAHWAVPVRSVARLGLPLIEGGDLPGERLRGQVAYNLEDVPVALAEELLGWFEAGEPSLVPGVDLLASLARGAAPLHLITGGDDALAPAAGAADALAAWGGEGHHTSVPELGHLDLLMGRASASQVHPPLLQWLDERRDDAWAEGRTVA
jgi:pimeloyl-ACP methyl ester carboxylesterase